MAIKTIAQKNTLADAYAAAAPYGAIYTTSPTTTQGTEPTGGTPAYARKALTWGAASNGVVTAVATFDVPTGTTIVGVGLHSAVTAGNYLDGGDISSQVFSSQGTLQVTFTYTQS